MLSDRNADERTFTDTDTWPISQVIGQMISSIWIIHIIANVTSAGDRWCLATEP